MHPLSKFYYTQSFPMVPHTPAALDGWIVIDKPYRLCSNAVLGRIKYLFRNARGCKPPKLGFSGTLDPLATGILPIAFGQALKTMHYMTLSTKEYTFEVTFGASTTTQDSEGEVIETSPVQPSTDDIRAIIPHFIGTLDQIPPLYSALRVNGQRAYTLAREGVDITLNSRSITIESLELREHHDGKATFHVVCGTGTYVRSLGRDIACALGTVGHISQLRRTRVGCFYENHAMTLDVFEKNMYDDQVLKIYPMGIGLDDILAVPITWDMYETFMKGQCVHCDFQPVANNQTVALWCDSHFMGFAVRQDGFLKPKRMINITQKDKIDVDFKRT